MNKTDKQAGFGTLGIVAIILVIALVGVAGWLVKVRSDGTSDQDVTASESSAANESANTPSTPVSGLVTTTVKGLDDPSKKTVVTVKHPSSWEVVNKVETDDQGLQSARAYIKSDKGHYLHINDNGGVGGACDDNSDKYTLVKRLSTQDQYYYFSEYTVGGGDSPFLSLVNERNHPEWAAMKEGDSATNTCNMPSYSFAGELYVSITGTATRSLVGKFTYAELKDDPEFIAMLQSLTVEE